MVFDVLIIGAGVVGLACAAQSVRRGLTTLLVERHASFGQETSSRNSEVIHSGIYYTPGSLKARLCVAANRRLYEECAAHDVWHSRCGKLVVAVTPEEEPELEKIYRRGIANGVEGLRMLTPAEVKGIEPNIRCVSALLVPSTGIVDSHELMKHYLHQARAGGADIVFSTEFLSAERNGSGYQVTLRDASGETVGVEVRMVVNAAGLACDSVAATFGIDVDAAGYRLYPNRGHYFRVSAAKSRLVGRLVYPVPHPHMTGIGIHITIDRGGQVRLGPDTEYVSSGPDTWYRFDESRKDAFYQAAARYFPALEPDDLSPDQVGVRPKIQRPGEPLRDFLINEESSRGLPGLVNLIGIESPGLTCAGVIAEEVFTRLGS